MEFEGQKEVRVECRKNHGKERGMNVMKIYCMKLSKNNKNIVLKQ